MTEQTLVLCKHDAVHRHLGVVVRAGEPGGDLDRRVELQPVADLRADAAALEERRRLDRAQRIPARLATC